MSAVKKLRDIAQYDYLVLDYRARLFSRARLFTHFKKFYTMCEIKANTITISIEFPKEGSAKLSLEVNINDLTLTMGDAKVALAAAVIKTLENLKIPFAYFMSEMLSQTANPSASYNVVSGKKTIM